MSKKLDWEKNVRTTRAKRSGFESAYYECPQIGSLSDQIRYLSENPEVKYNSNKEKDLICPICKENFYIEFDLSRHLKNIHNKHLCICNHIYEISLKNERCPRCRVINLKIMREKNHNLKLQNKSKKKLKNKKSDKIKTDKHNKISKKINTKGKKTSHQTQLVSPSPKLNNNEFGSNLGDILIAAFKKVQLVKQKDNKKEKLRIGE